MYTMIHAILLQKRQSNATLYGSLNKNLHGLNVVHAKQQLRKKLTQSEETPAPVTSISSVPKAALADSPKDIYRGRSLQGLSGPSLQKSPANQ
jgi:hypothetical protein